MPDLKDIRILQQDLTRKRVKSNKLRRYIESKASELGMNEDDLNDLLQGLSRKKA